MRRRVTLALPILIGLLVVACASPEATRVRAGGPGADVGNRGSVVNMHEGSQPFWNTPRLIGTQGPPLDTAHQADHLSR